MNGGMEQDGVVSSPSALIQASLYDEMREEKSINKRSKMVGSDEYVAVALKLLAGRLASYFVYFLMILPF